MIFKDQTNNLKEDTRDIIFDNESHKTLVINRGNLLKNKKYNGPLVIEEDSATTVIPPNQELKVDQHGNLIIRKNN